MREDRLNVVYDSIEYYGANKQLTKAIEEMGECIVEVAKNVQGYSNREAVISEVADVYNALEIIKAVLGINEMEVEMERDFKIARLKNRMETGYDYGKL